MDALLLFLSLALPNVYSENKMKRMVNFHFVHIKGLTNNNGKNAVSLNEERRGSFVYLWFIVIILANDGVLCHSRRKKPADIL